MGVRGPAALGGLDDGGRPDPEPVPQGHARIPVALDREVGNARTSARDAGAPAPLPEGGEGDAGRATDVMGDVGAETT